LDLLKAVREFNGTDQHDPIDFRVGIATGPVVAGVVGLKRFLFDMWYVDVDFLYLVGLP
jgi:class 3 adenylate cyclase